MRKREWGEEQRERDKQTPRSAPSVLRVRIPWSWDNDLSWNEEWGTQPAEPLRCPSLQSIFLFFKIYVFISERETQRERERQRETERERDSAPAGAGVGGRARGRSRLSAEWGAPHRAQSHDSEIMKTRCLTQVVQSENNSFLKEVFNRDTLAK